MGLQLAGLTRGTSRNSALTGDYPLTVTLATPLDRPLKRQRSFDYHGYPKGNCELARLCTRYSPVRAGGVSSEHCP